MYRVRSPFGRDAPKSLKRMHPETGVRSARPEAASDTRSPYQCDGRTHCSQMISCEEAEFFLANCPGLKMDGGGDGVPCEKQWCGDR